LHTCIEQASIAHGIVIHQVVAHLTIEANCSKKRKEKKGTGYLNA
jgi:hypothetical protein